MNAEDHRKWLLRCSPHPFASLQVHGEDIHDSLSSGKKMTSFKILHVMREVRRSRTSTWPLGGQGSKSMSITPLCSYFHKLLLYFQQQASSMPAASPPHWTAGLPALSLTPWSTFLASWTYHSLHMLHNPLGVLVDGMGSVLPCSVYPAQWPPALGHSLPKGIGCLPPPLAFLMDFSHLPPQPGSYWQAKLDSG